MPRKKKQDASVLSMEEIAGMTPAKAADAVGERYQTKRRVFVEMGKLVDHLDHANLRNGQTVYGILKSRGVPESSVNNCRLVATFIDTFVRPGLVSETRMDEIITYRIANQCSRMIKGKTEGSMPPEQLAEIINAGDKAAIFDELECIGEHGMTLADKEKADAEAEAEAKRVAEANAAAEKAEQEAAAKAAADAASSGPEAPTPEAEPEPESPDESPEPEETPAPEETDESDSEPEETDAPEEEEEPATVVDGRGEPDAPESDGSEKVTPISGRGGDAAKVESILGAIEKTELESYGLEPGDLAKVRAKLADWIDTIDSTIAAGKDEVALAG